MLWIENDTVFNDTVKTLQMIYMFKYLVDCLITEDDAF